MSRTDKLYDALATLERQFLKMVIEEFGDRYPSNYLSRKIPHLLDGKKWCNVRTGELERLEKDIVALRAKLGEPLADNPVAVVHAFIAARGAAKDRYDGGIKRLKRETRDKLQAMIQCTSSS